MPMVMRSAFGWKSGSLISFRRPALASTSSIVPEMISAGGVCFFISAITAEAFDRSSLTAREGSIRVSPSKESER